MKRLIILLVSRAGLSHAEFTVTMRPHATVFANRCASVGAIFRHGYQMQPDPLAAAAVGRNIVPISGIFEASLPDAGDVNQLLMMVEHLAARIADGVDASETAILVGDVHTVLPPRGSVMLAAGTRRRPSLDQAGFNDHWLRTHAPLALSLMTEEQKSLQGMDQLHADAALSERAALVSGLSIHNYDGVLQSTVDSVETFIGIHANPEFDAIIYADEENFIDRASDFRGAFLILA